MKKSRKVIVMILIVFIILGVTIFGLDYMQKTTLRAVVVKVDDDGLLVDGIGRVGLCRVDFTEKGDIGFKQGQEVCISFDGSIMETYPSQLRNVKKIKILKEKSDKEISKRTLQYVYSSKDNVKVTVNEFTPTSITFTIVDNNELPYDYYSYYKIEQKVKNPDYTGVGQKIGEDTQNSIAGYTRNRT